MATLISVASGKGGVGKSIVSVNLALALAKAGRKVLLADLDVGGADAHIMFGELNPPVTLTDFLNKRVDRLDDVAIPVVCDLWSLSRTDAVPTNSKESNEAESLLKAGTA